MKAFALEEISLRGNPNQLDTTRLDGVVKHRCRRLDRKRAVAYWTGLLVSSTSDVTGH